MKNINSLLVILMSIILTACSGSSDPIDPTPSPTPDNDKITFASGVDTSLSFDAEGGSATIGFTTSKTWTATLTNSNSDSWCQVEPASGQAGTGSLTIKVAANEDPDGKSAVVQIKSGTATASINVNQIQKNAIVIANKEYALEKDSTHLDFEVKANVDFKVKVEGEWITQVESRGLTATTLYFDIAENATGVEREGKIIISSDDIVQEIIVVQAAAEVSVELIAEYIYEINSVVEPLFMESETIEELAEHVEDIKKIPGVANVWTTNTALYVRTKSGFEQFWLYTSHRLNERSESADYSLTRTIPSSRSFSWENHDSETMKGRKKVGIINQMKNDANFNYLASFHESLEKSFEDVDYVVHREDDIAKLLDKYGTFDLIFYDTHGSYDPDSKMHALISGYEIEVKCSGHDKNDEIEHIEEILKDKYDGNPKGIGWAHIKELRETGEKCVIYEAYWETYFAQRKSDFVNSIVFCGACEAMKGNDGLAESFGAKTFIGYDDVNNISEKSASQFFEFMLQGMTTGESFENLDDSYRTNLSANLVIVGDGDICIVHPEPITDKVTGVYATGATLKGRIEGWAKSLKGEIGFCYSSTEKEPTIEKKCDNIILNKDLLNGNFVYSMPIEGLELGKTYYYRSYIRLDRSEFEGMEDVYSYGEIMEFTTEESEDSAIRALLKLIYEQTNGDNWTNNENWLSDKPIDEWYGVYISDDVRYYGQIWLNLNNNNLTGHIDLSLADDLAASALSLLGQLNCGGNHLKRINVSVCTALISLSCLDNQLTKLDVSGCSSLSDLSCSANQLTNLDVSNCLELFWLHCHTNQLTSLDVSNNLKLTHLFCWGNELKTLDVSGCLKLEFLECGNNQLTDLSLSGFSNLKRLSCSQNELTNLNVTGCSSLADLNCQFNLLERLDVSSCSALIDLRASFNQLISLNAVGCKNLVRLGCDQNQLTDLNVAGCSMLNTLACKNNQLANLDVSSCIVLDYLNCSSNQLTDLDVSSCSKLTSLSCSSNQLTNLNVLGCSTLEMLSCPSNQLSGLDVSNCSALSFLQCGGNLLTNLDVSNLSKLEDLRCENNQLESLDVSGCAMLSILYCRNNKILGEISKQIENLDTFEHDMRYSYERVLKNIYEIYLNQGYKVTGKTYEDYVILYKDNGVGWWYSGEPGKGSHSPD